MAAPRLIDQFPADEFDPSVVNYVGEGEYRGHPADIYHDPGTGQYIVVSGSTVYVFVGGCPC